MSLEEIYKKAEHFDEHFAELIPRDPYPFGYIRSYVLSYYVIL